MPRGSPKPLPVGVLKRLRTIRQAVKEYPGLFPSEDSLRWQLRMLKADYGGDLRAFGVYRNNSTGRILIDPVVFAKDIVK